MHGAVLSKYGFVMKSVPEALFRDHAANERTLLTWIRTGIALMAFGFAIARFGLFLREIANVRGLHEQPTRGILVALAMAVILARAI